MPKNPSFPQIDHITYIEPLLTPLGCQFTMFSSDNGGNGKQMLGNFPTFSHVRIGSATLIDHIKSK